MSTPRVFIQSNNSYGDAVMLELDPSQPKYVRLEDFEELDKRFQLEIGIARTNEADARASAANSSRHNARYMMIEHRLRNALRDHLLSHPAGGQYSTISGTLAQSVLNLLGSEPPVGEGFQTVQGLTPNGIKADYKEWGDYPTAAQLGSAIEAAAQVIGMTPPFRSKAVYGYDNSEEPETNG